MRTIAIINQKGGCGKTTSAINLAGVFARKGKKTLLVDMDPQSHCAAGLAIPEQRIDVQIGDAMANPPAAGRTLDWNRLLWRVSRNLDLAPSTVRLASLEAPRGGLAGADDAEKRLDAILTRLADQYDLCLIDCPPGIGLLTFNALFAATEVIIPVETGFFALQGASKQVQTIKAMGKKLGIAPPYRIVPTMHDDSSALAREVLEQINERFKGFVAPTVIRLDPRLREAVSFGQPAVEYAPDSNGAQDYLALGEWLIRSPIKSRPTVAAAPNAVPTNTDDDQPPSPVTTRPAAAESLLAAPSHPSPLTPLADKTPVAAAAPQSPTAATATTATATATTPLPALTNLFPSTPSSPAASPSTINPNLSAGAALAAMIRADLSAAVMGIASAHAALGNQPAAAAPTTNAPSLAQTQTPTHVPTLLPVAGRVRVNSLELINTPPTTSIPTDPAIRHLLGPRETSQGVLFIVPASLGRSIYIAGQFNNWSLSETPMRLNLDLGVFEATVPLPPGKHEYRLIVDGRWIADPYNPVVSINPFGEANSAVHVTTAPIPQLASVMG
ncbi:MAG: AAA family ATPase [Phycisphaerales bacterium]|nr:AAA family ATPase [Phycisphaerales bacterium]